MATKTFNTPTTSIIEPIKVLLGIIQNQINLDDNHIYLANQDHVMPKDGLSVMLEYLGPDEQIAVKSYFNAAINEEVQQLVTRHVVQISVMSLAPDNSARIRMQEIPLALQSFYSMGQQDLNQVSIAWLTSGFIDGSYQDGTTMLNRFITTCHIFALHQKIISAGYLNIFPIELISNGQGGPQTTININDEVLPYAV